MNNFSPVAWLLAVLLAAQGCSKTPDATPAGPRPLPAVQVADIGYLAGRSFPGRAQAAKEVELSFRVAGPLVELPVSVGDTLVEGAVIAQIDPRDFRVAVQREEGQLDRARGALTRARNDFERLQNVYREDPGATSETAVDRAEAEFVTASGNVKSLEAALAAAQDALGDTTLEAPFDATVVAKYVENFEEVRAKQPIVRLLNTDQIEMVINIPENLIAQAPYVQDIVVAFDAFPDREIKATISEIGTEASATTRTFPVTLVMDQPDDVTILAGMAGSASGRARLPGELAQGDISVPLAATFSTEAAGETYVWVINEETGVVARRAITVGHVSNRGVAVSEGLQAGEWVAVAGVNTLREGQQVRIATADGE